MSAYSSFRTIAFNTSLQRKVVNKGARLQTYPTKFVLTILYETNSNQLYCTISFLSLRKHVALGTSNARILFRWTGMQNPFNRKVQYVQQQNAKWISEELVQFHIHCFNHSKRALMRSYISEPHLLIIGGTMYPASSYIYIKQMNQTYSRHYPGSITTINLAQFIF